MANRPTTPPTVTRTASRHRPAAPVHRWLLAAVAVVATGVVAPTAAPAAASPGPAPSETPSAPTGTFVPLEPCRLLDTRTDAPDRIGPSSPMAVEAGGRCGVPDDAIALSLSIATTEPLGEGFLTLWPAEQVRPLAATLTFALGETRSNGAVVPTSAHASFGVFANVATHVVVDVTGAFVPAESATSGRFVAMAPARLLDTRSTGSPLPAGSSVRVPLPAAAPRDATALAVTIATTDAAGPGFFTAHPTGQDRPHSSALTTDRRGQVRAAGQIVPVGPAGFELYTQSGAHLIVDVTGWFTGPSAPSSNDGLFVPMTPTRLVDTRLGTAIQRGGTIGLDPASTAGRTVAAIAANWTMTESWGPGFVTAYPARTSRPLAATVNAERRRQTVAQFGLAATSATGIGVYANAGTDVVVDMTGWFTGTPIPPSEPDDPPNTHAVDINRVALLVGDSTLAGVRWYGNSRAALRGSTFVLDVESCRRLVLTSCRGREGRTPPTTLSALQAFDGTADVVVIMTGYNDWYSSFERSFQLVVDAARAKGARTIVWLTYREKSTYTNPTGGTSQTESFRLMNQILRDAVASGDYPDVVLADWSGYTNERDDWFVHDGVHFTIAGSYGAADYISRVIASLHGDPCPAPWTVGGTIEPVCTQPDLRPGVVDPMGLYHGNPADLHCYLVGGDLHEECRVDPKLD